MDTIRFNIRTATVLLKLNMIKVRSIVVRGLIIFMGSTFYVD